MPVDAFGSLIGFKLTGWPRVTEFTPDLDFQMKLIPVYDEGDGPPIELDLAEHVMMSVALAAVMAHFYLRTRRVA